VLLPGGIQQCEAIIKAAFRPLCQQAVYEVNSLPVDFLAIAPTEIGEYQISRQSNPALRLSITKGNRSRILLH
jgi:hypothetical protein